MSAYPHLFSPLTVGGVELRNRIVQTGHVTGMAAGNVPGEQLTAYYRERARGGVAMIISEAGSVHPTARHMSAVVQLYDERIVDAYRTLVPQLHALGCRFVAQLWHAGNNTDGLSTEREPWAPSAIAGVLNHEIAHEVTTEEIRELVDAYGRATENAVRGGTDGVELHAGHGYIPQQFMSPALNKRTDEYGGSLENRLRFTCEVLDAVREAAGGRILGLRMSADQGVPGGLGLDENLEIARRLAALGVVSYFSVSFGNYSNMELQIAPMGMRLGYLAHLAGAVREVVRGVPVLAVGRITTPEVAEQILAEGQADIVGLARQLMADPEFARKAGEGHAAEIRPCVGTNFCMSRMWAGQHLSCVHNPAAGRERELGVEALRPAEQPRRVAVVGGGPAGLEAARVAALRGHRVTVYEREDRLGGQVRLAARVASRRELAGIIDYLERELDRLGVEVETGRELGVHDLEGVDAVVVATGSRALARGFNAARSDLPGIPGIETAGAALTGREALADGDGLGQRVLVVDFEGHVQGLSVAEHLLDAGREVELVTQHAIAGGKIGATAWMKLMQDVARKGGVLTPSSLVDGVAGTTVHVLDLWSGRRSAREGVDALVVVGDSVADDGLARALRAAHREFVAVGDCVAPRHLDMAFLEANRAARSL